MSWVGFSLVLAVLAVSGWFLWAVITFEGSIAQKIKQSEGTLQVLVWIAVIAWLAWVGYSPEVRLGEARMVRVTNDGRAEVFVPMETGGTEFAVMPLPVSPSGVTEPVGGRAAAVVSPLVTWLPSGTEIRFEPLRGNNLDIYLSDESFEAVPFPDRKEFVRDVGEAWCDSTGARSQSLFSARYSHFFLPSVRIRDIRSGDKLASYNCVLPW